ncbi:MAG: acyltransferase, partial [Eggerthellaceae bacterium]|nr:acyltransferase [Eggerthellaceae bacterium]
IAAVVGLIVMVVLTNGFEPFIYRGGLVLCSLLTAVAIAVLVHPISWISKVFELPPFVWIGKCSYSMYLWHFPIILLLTPANMQGETPWWLCLVELALIFAISAFSYYIVENPIRHGAIGNFIGDVREGLFTVPEWISSHLALVVPALLIFVVSIGGLALVPDTSAVQNANSMKLTVATKTLQSAQQARMKANAQLEARKPDILVIGDSVPMGMYGYGAFGEVFPGGYCDTAIGRQFYDAASIYAEYRDLQLVGNPVVIALGTNGYATDEDAEALMAEVGDEQRIWFVNTRSPEEYVESTNAVIQRVCDNHENAQLIDWYSISADHPEYFDGDGTHLTPEAAETYAWMIYDAVREYLPDRTDEERKAAAEGAAEAASSNGLSEEG